MIAVGMRMKADDGSKSRRSSPMVVLCSNGDAGVKQWLVCLQGGDDGHANGGEL